MKIIAIEQELKPLTNDAAETYRNEARHVYALYLKNVLREIYLTEARTAVLILECAGIEEARQILATLPLFQSGTIDFEVHELAPYKGYGRLMQN